LGVFKFAVSAAGWELTTGHAGVWRKDTMTDKKLEELKMALNSVGLVLLSVEENTRIGLDYEVSPDYAEYLENKSVSEVYTRNRVWISAAPLPLSNDFVKQ
jgi:hypothetical protein